MFLQHWQLTLLATSLTIVCIICIYRTLYLYGNTALKKKKIKFSSYRRKFRMKHLQSHIWITASSYMVKYLHISPYIRKPFLTYDLATAPFWISLYMRKIWFSILFIHVFSWLYSRDTVPLIFHSLTFGRSLVRKISKVSCLFIIWTCKPVYWVGKAIACWYVFWIYSTVRTQSSSDVSIITSNLYTSQGYI